MATRERIAPAALVARVTAHLRPWIRRWQRTRPARANARFGAAGGGLLTGGIAYTALFSVAAALTLGVTVFTAVLGNDAVLRDRVLDTVSDALPGLVDTGDGQGAIDPASLRVTAGLSITGVIAVVVLVLSAVSFMAALRTAVRAMFGQTAGGGNAFAGKLRELAGLVGMGLAVLVSAVLTLGLTSAVHWLLSAVGLGPGAGWVVQGVGVLVSFVVDAVMFALILVVLAGVHPPRRELRRGAVIAGVGLGAVRLLGTSVVAGSTGKNALLASFAVVATLLIWVNLVSRIVLLAAAWVADPPLVAPPDGESSPDKESSPDEEDSPDGVGSHDGVDSSVAREVAPERRR